MNHARGPWLFAIALFGVIGCHPGCRIPDLIPGPSLEFEFSLPPGAVVFFTTGPIAVSVL